ncbi:MAG: hypothetical protein WAP08_08525 [Smithellaceae bacterium]|jgi:hypothetical protein|nr:MAG: hypothetical protein BWX77_01351 [Bacteroidetes bacterium ADurb.Bin090]
MESGNEEEKFRKNRIKHLKKEYGHMDQIYKNKWLSLFVAVLAVFIFIDLSNAMADSDPFYPGFIKLQETNCIVMDDFEIRKLPQDWYKYKGFVKKCPLKKDATSQSDYAIVSIWAYDYLQARGSMVWEDFPLPLIVDAQFNPVGVFPEIYPMDSPTHLIVYYGKWQGDIPGEILIDVSNPAVSGDYYYEPLIWDKKTGKYEMKDRQDKSGPRPTMHREKKSKQ